MLKGVDFTNKQKNIRIDKNNLRIAQVKVRFEGVATEEFPINIKHFYNVSS